MNINKWTASLAAMGILSAGSIACVAETPAMLQTAASTVISGYVDTSMQWNLGTGDAYARDTNMAVLREPTGLTLT